MSSWASHSFSVCGPLFVRRGSLRAARLVSVDSRGRDSGICVGLMFRSARREVGNGMRDRRRGVGAREGERALHFYHDSICLDWLRSRGCQLRDTGVARVGNSKQAVKGGRGRGGR
jgi:hypothetical protein